MAPNEIYICTKRPPPPLAPHGQRSSTRLGQVGTVYVGPEAAGQLSPKPGRHSHVVRRLDPNALGSQASLDDADTEGVVTVLRTGLNRLAALESRLSSM